MYIAVEGLKGVGKSTLLDSLCQRLRDENVRFSLLTPTRPLPYACWIEGLAKHWPSLRQYDYFCQSLYAYRSNGHSRLTDWTQPLILGDRSILTSLVTRWPHQNCYMQAQYVQQVRAREHEIQWPDEVMYLSVPLPQLLKRLQSRCRNYGQYDECVERLTAAAQAYDSLAHVGEFLGLPAKMNWHTVDAAQQPEQVLEEVYDWIKRRCPQAWCKGEVNNTNYLLS